MSPNRWRLALAGTAWLLSLTLALGLHTRAAETPRNSFHFSIVGDRTGTAQPQVYSRVWREIGLLGPDFAINVGDTIQGGKDETAEREWAEVRSVWRKYNTGRCVYYLIPGNHDIWSAKSEAIYRKETGRAPHYSFDYQNAHFVVLDNSRTEELGESELQFLKADLAAHQDRKPKFVFFHRPFWIDYVRAGKKDAPLHRICKEYGVDYVVSGHGHELCNLPFDGVHYLEVGSSGAHTGDVQAGEGFARGQFFHHIWATVRNGDVALTVKEIDGTRGKGRMSRAGDWNGSTPRFNADDPAASENPQ